MDGRGHGAQLGDGLGEPKRAGWTGAGRAPRFGAHEGARTADGVAREAKPQRGPQHVRDGKHGLAGNIRERDGHDLVSVEPEASRVKPRLRVPRIPSVSQSPVRVRRSVGLADEHEHLIRRRGVGRAPRGQQDVVGFLAIGDDGRTFGDRECASRPARRHRRCAADRRPRQAPTSPRRSATHGAASSAR